MKGFPSISNKTLRHLSLSRSLSPLVTSQHTAQLVALVYRQSGYIQEADNTGPDSCRMRAIVALMGSV